MKSQNSLKLLLLCIATLLSLGLGLVLGPVSLSLPSISELLSPSHSLDTTLLLEVRLPRVINGFITGGALSLAGVFMQVLLNNPLADPYILGVSSGASFAVLIAMLLGANLLHIPLYATLGASAVSILVYLISHNLREPRTLYLLLTGILITCALGALIQCVLILFPEPRLPGALFWLLGDLPQLPIAWPNLAMLMLALLYGFSLSNPLNLFTRGVMQARILGLETKHLQSQLFILSAILTASAVSLAGNIGFLGLMMPHFTRLFFGSDHKMIIPCATLAGGSLFVLADLCSRTLFAPNQLPVGIFMTLLGVPAFLYLLQKTKGRA